MVEVQLTPTEIMMGAQAGVMRQVQNLNTNGSKPTYGLEGNNQDWQIHIEGTLAEQAVAKHLNTYWSGKGRRGDVDVGDVDVRSTHHMKGCLIVHPGDPDDRFFYLALGLNGAYRIPGGMYGREAKQDKYWRDGIARPAYFVPAADLYFPKEGE